MPLPALSPNRKINIRKVLEENRRQANKIDSLDAQGFKISQPGDASVDFPRIPKMILAREPAIEATVVNIGDDAIGPFRVVAIVEDFNNDTTEDDFEERLVGTRALSVRKPTRDDMGNIAVLKQGLETDEVGKAYVGGTCLVEMERWFDTPILNYVDAQVDDDLGLAQVQGSLRILWEEDDGEDSDPRVLPIDLAHFAVVRFTDDYRTVPFKNQSGPLLQGGPATPINPGLDSTEKTYAFRRPPSAGLATVYTVVGGPVANGETGRAVFAGLPFLALLDTEGIVGDNYGTDADSSKYTKDQPGFRLIATLGTHDGEEWGVLHYKSPFEVTDFKGRASLDSTSPGTPGPGDGTLELDPASGDEKIVVLEFVTPLTHLNGYEISVGHGAKVTIETPAGLTSLGGSVTVKGITSAFDTATVTYGTRPSTAAGPAVTHDVLFTADSVLKAATVDVEAEVGSSADFFVQKVPTLSPTGLFFGLEIVLGAVSVAPGGKDLLGEGDVTTSGFAFRL